MHLSVGKKVLPDLSRIWLHTAAPGKLTDVQCSPCSSEGCPLKQSTLEFGDDFIKSSLLIFVHLGWNFCITNHGHSHKLLLKTIELVAVQGRCMKMFMLLS
jgi:hypothetical protein